MTTTQTTPAARDRCDEISSEIRALLREAVETAVPFGHEAAREAARVKTAAINELLDGFLPV